MDEATLAAAAQAVVENRLARRRLARLTGLASLEDGYLVQQRANELLEAQLGRARRPQDRRHHRSDAALHPCAGAAGRRDLRATAPSRRRHGPALGPCPARHRDGDRGPPRGGAAARPEPYGRDEMAGAVAAMMAAIELVDDRYVDFATIGAPTLVADNAFDAGSVLGAPVTQLARPRPRRADRPHVPGRRADRRGPQRLAARPPAGRAGLARQPSLAPGAGAGCRHVRQPGHHDAGAMGRRAVAMADRGRGAGRGLGDGGVSRPAPASCWPRRERSSWRSVHRPAKDTPPDAARPDPARRQPARRPAGARHPDQGRDDPGGRARRSTRAGTTSSTCRAGWSARRSSTAISTWTRPCRSGCRG